MTPGPPQSIHAMGADLNPGTGPARPWLPWCAPSCRSMPAGSRSTPTDPIRSTHPDRLSPVGQLRLDGRRSGVLGVGGVLVAEHLARPSPHLYLALLAGHPHRELIDRVDIPRNLVVRQLAGAVVLQRLGSQFRRARAELYPDHQLLAEPRVRHPDHLGVHD